MWIRMMFVAAALLWSAQALAGGALDASPGAREGAHDMSLESAPLQSHDNRYGAAPIAQPAGAPAALAGPDSMTEPVSLTATPVQASPLSAAAAQTPQEQSPQEESERGQVDPLNAPFWVYLLWYLGSR
jgi:hypothetical protein